MMRWLHRWHRVPPEGVYALYEGGDRVGPLPMVYDHYAKGMHLWEVLVPAENVEKLRGLDVDILPPGTQLRGRVSGGIESYQWDAEGDSGE